MRVCPVSLVLVLAGAAAAATSPSIFPVPRAFESVGAPFSIDENVPLLLPVAASESDGFLARCLQAELSDRGGIALRTQRVRTLPAAGRYILMGTIANPLVAEYRNRKHLEVDAARPGPEGYLLEVTPNVLFLAGSDAPGAFYGFQSLRQLIEKQDQALRVPGVRVRDWPYKSFRGVKLYLPGRANIPFFKRFVRDFLALYKYNRVILEMNAAMRLDRHPELNAGWIEFAKNLVYTRRDRPTGPHEQFQDSTHHDTADGGVLEKEEVEDLVRWCRLHFVEVIPELPSLTHSYYLLTRHRELAEIAAAEWPDTYCPSNPKSYTLLFDVLDEYIQVMKPRMMHLGHDEWRMPVDVCPLCKGKDPRELFAQDVNKIHDYLKRKNIRMAIWGDHLIQELTGERTKRQTTPAGYPYSTPGGLTPAQVTALIPKDILIFNWFWSSGSRVEGAEGASEKYETKLADWGFEQVYGNFTPGIREYGRRSGRAGIVGGAPSAWVGTTEFNFGKDVISDFAACANLLWSIHWPEPKDLSQWIRERMPGIRRSLSGQSPPSEDGDPVVAVDLPAGGAPPVALQSGRIAIGKKVFHLNGGALAAAPHGEAPAVKIGEDASSLLFLHACARAGRNEAGYRTIFNFPDTADLLGWYEVVYQDGLVDTIPIRYGLNTLQWNAGGSARAGACYLADAVSCGRDAPATFYAFEWVNPRFGKIIQEVRLRGASGFVDYQGRVRPDNAVFLAALSYVKKRK